VRTQPGSPRPRPLLDPGMTPLRAKRSHTTRQVRYVNRIGVLRLHFRGGTCTKVEWLHRYTSSSSNFTLYQLSVIRIQGPSCQPIEMIFHFWPMSWFWG
jgi:hypothetical protein